MKKTMIVLLTLTSISTFAGVCEKELRDCKSEIRDEFNHYLCVPQANDHYANLDEFCNEQRKEYKVSGMSQCKLAYLSCDEDHEYSKPQQQVRP